MSRKRYRIAVVGGVGTWGRYYLYTYANHPDCDIVALVDLARDRRQVFADHYRIKSVFDTVEDLLEKEIPDIVSIILPVGVSHKAVIACAEAGVRVVSCEKPIAVQLAQADAMVRICREHGVALGCGTAHWETPFFSETVHWLRDGNLGSLKSVIITAGLPDEVSGGGCAQLAMMRFLTGMEVEWVQGWALPEDAARTDDDCTAYGRLGFPQGIICDIQVPEPRKRFACRISAVYENGQVWIARPRPVIVRNFGTRSSPVYPDFFTAPGSPKTFFVPAIERLIRAFDTNGEIQCSGHDYRQVLEIAVAMKKSARENHRRIRLPLQDRTLKITPTPYRLKGGDVLGWENTEYKIPCAFGRRA